MNNPIGMYMNRLFAKLSFFFSLLLKFCAHSKVLDKFVVVFCPLINCRFKKKLKEKGKEEMEGREGIPIRGEMNEIETARKARRKRRKREEKSVTLIKQGIFQLHALLSRPAAKLFPARVQSLVRIDVLLVSSAWVPCE